MPLSRSRQPDLYVKGKGFDLEWAHALRLTTGPYVALCYEWSFESLSVEQRDVTSRSGWTSERKPRVTAWPQLLLPRTPSYRNSQLVYLATDTVST